MYLLIPHAFAPIHLSRGSATNVRTSPRGVYTKSKTKRWDGKSPDLAKTLHKIYLMRNSPMSRAFVMPSVTTSHLQEVSEHKRSKANLKPESPWNTVLKNLYVVRIFKNEVINLIYNFECMLEAPEQTSNGSNFDVTSAAHLIRDTFRNLAT